ncbi:MAG: DUF6265 family protein [Gemmatimonadota bacterium]
MKSFTIVVLLVTCCSLVTKAAAQDRIQSAGWLAGCWQGQRSNRLSTEMWMPPGGGVMLGASRTSVEGVVQEIEQMKLSVQGGHLVFSALLPGQPETPFTSIQVTDSSFIVENLGHDFPQRIVYRRIGADSLLARIEGPGSGGPQSVAYPMRRISCTVP